MTSCLLAPRRFGYRVMVAALVMAAAGRLLQAEELADPPAACRLVIEELGDSVVVPAAPVVGSPVDVSSVEVTPADATRVDGVAPIDDVTLVDGLPPVEIEIGIETINEPAGSMIELSDYSDAIVSDDDANDCASDSADDSNCDVVYPKFGDWLGYNSRQDGLTWIAGGDLSWTSLEWFPSLDVGQTWSIDFDAGFHFLGGPTSTDLPPRLFDFQMAYLSRKPLTDATTLDIKLGVGAFSDFETSARKGVRFPGHVVAHTQQSDRLATVLGVDVLDRDDITLLPVAGVIWQPYDGLILDVAFPRPKIQLRVNEDSAFYVLGELGGGTWAIQRDDGSRDNATYHDLRVLFGSVHFGDESESVVEIGWTFDRELTYRSRRGDRNLDGAFLLRWQTLY